MAITKTKEGVSSNVLYKGLSSDTKPIIGVQNGDSYYEMDTVELYMFDEDSQQWIKQ